MDYPQTIKNQAVKRSGGKCECTRSTHGHSGRCNERFGVNWFIHPKSSLRSKDDLSLSNAEVLCSPCHEARQLLGVL
ncbi:MAG: hypothetical protein ACHQM6_04135 [Candidatus Kapaibacterium sp.]